MNYLNAYNKLIVSRKYGPSLLPYRKTNGQLGEWHHIVPKHIGGSDLENNEVFLTHREHYIAHKLLAKIYPEMQYAFYRMAFSNNAAGKHKIGSLEYARLCKLQSKVQSKNRLGSKHSGATKQKISESHKGKRLSEETKQKISDANKGKPGKPGCRHTKAAKLKMSESQKGNQNGLKPAKLRLARLHALLEHGFSWKLHVANEESCYNTESAARKYCQTQGWTTAPGCRGKRNRRYTEKFYSDCKELL